MDPNPKNAPVSRIKRNQDARLLGRSYGEPIWCQQSIEPVHVAVAIAGDDIDHLTSRDLGRHSHGDHTRAARSAVEPESVQLLGNRPHGVRLIRKLLGSIPHHSRTGLQVERTRLHSQRGFLTEHLASCRGARKVDFEAARRRVVSAGGVSGVLHPPREHRARGRASGESGACTYKAV